MKNEAIPRLRFKGFHDKWIYNQLDNLASYIQRGKSPKYGASKYPVISQKCIGWNHINIHEAKTIVPQSLETYSYDRFLQPEDILWNSTGTGTLGRATIIKGSLLNNYKHLVTDSHVTVIRINNAIPEFIYNYIQTKKVQYFILSLAMSGSTNQIELNKSAVEKLNIPTPSLPEQQLIGKFFAKLDKLIRLQQKKLSLLKKLKQGYLQKLFPRKSESVPRLRFKEFHDKWTLVDITDIANIVGGGTPSTNNKRYWNGNINWYSPDEISHCKSPYVYSSKRKITKEGLNNSSAHLHPANTTILFTTRATIGDMAILKSPASTNQGFQSLELKSYISPYFIYSYKNIIKYKALRLSHGSTFKEVSKNDLKELNLLIPTYKEQYKIGQLFKQLDKNILHQDIYCLSLYKLKKAYLQKMFC